MINKRWDLIKKEDIDGLVSNEVSEGRTIEYKEKLPGNSDGDKIEFLADVSSIANASGGDLLFGVREKRDDNGKTTGIPEAADGLDQINADAEILRLENIIRDCIDRRITGIHIWPLNGFPKGPIIMLRIPKSWASPHMITFKGLSRFYSRNSAGKYQLDVTEIRSAFLLSETLPEKIRRFRDERLAKIIADETPVPLDPSPKMVLHLLPIAALDPTTRLDVIPLAQQTTKLSPIYAHGWSHRYNFDGFLTYSSYGDRSTCPTYLQIFRNGAIEAIEASILSEEWKKNKIIPSLLYERELISALERYLVILRDLGLEPPIFVMLSLLGVKGYLMGVDSLRFWSQPRDPIDRDALLLHDSIVEDYESKAADILRPAFDAVWQAAGWPRSMNYDENGKWVGK